MKNVIVAGVAALALVGCGAKEEAVVEATPVVEEAPAEEVAVEAAEAPAAEIAAEVAPTSPAEAVK
jgi:uncharacterized protein YcfL